MHESDDNHMVYEPDHTITNAQESNHSNIKRALIVIGILVLILAGTALSVIWYVSLPPTIDEQEAEQVIAPEKILPQHEDLSGAPLVKPYLGTQISATLVDSIFEDGWYSSGRQPFVASATEMMLYEEPVMGITLTALPGETVSISRNVSLPEEKNTLYFCLESVGESEGHLEVQFTSDGTPVDQARLITAFRLENARVITPPNGDILMRELPNWLVNGTGTLSLLLINSGTEPASLKVTNFHYYGEGEYLLSPEDAVDRCLVRRAEAVPEANSPEGSPQFQAEVTRARESIKIFAKPGAATSSHIATLPTGMTRPNSTEFGRNGSTVLYESNFNGSWSDYVNNTQLADVYRGPVLSDDGNTVAYIREQAVNNTTSLVLVNGGAETILPNYT